MIKPENHALNSDEALLLYGPGASVMEDLGAVKIGQSGTLDYAAAFRFMAPKNGVISKARILFVGGTGNAAGSGGVVRFQIVPVQSNNTPDLSGQVLGQADLSISSDMLSGTTSREVTFASTQSLTAGTRYCLVMRNMGVKTYDNFISAGTMSMRATNGRPLRWIQRNDWAAMLSVDQKMWNDLTITGTETHKMQPILQLTYSDGTSFGHAASDGGQTDTKCLITTSAKPIRELFRFSRSRVIDGLSIFMACEVPGSLDIVTLKNDVTVLNVTKINSTIKNSTLQSADGTQWVSQYWYDIKFQSPVYIAAGEALSIEIYPQGDAQWRVSSQMNGSAIGFTSPAAFTDSEAQVLMGRAWVRFSHSDHSQAFETANACNFRLTLHSNAPNEQPSTPANPSVPSITWPASAGDTSGILTSSRAILEKAIDGMRFDWNTPQHDIDYLGWTNPDHSKMSPTGGAQNRGGAIVFGGALKLDDIYGSTLWNTNLDGAFSRDQMEANRYALADTLQLWGCIAPGVNGTNAKVEYMSKQAFVLLKGENVWRKIIDVPRENLITWSKAQGPSMNPHNKLENATGYAYNLNPQFVQTSYGVYTTTPNNRYSNNHYGHGDMSLDEVKKRIDLSRVEGIMGIYVCRMHPDDKGKQVGAQMGFDPKWYSITLPEDGWWPGLMLSRLQRVPDEWGTIAFVNVSTAGDANRGGLTITPERIRGTTIEGYAP